MHLDEHPAIYRPQQRHHVSSLQVQHLAPCEYIALQTSWSWTTVLGYQEAWWTHKRFS